MSWTLKQLPDQIESLAKQGRTAADRWSLAQITEHLALTMEWSIGRVPSTPPAWRTPAPLRPWVRRIFLGIGWLPHVPTLASLIPAPDVDFEPALKRLRAAVAGLDQPAAPAPEHPYFGAMTPAQWRRFHWVHARHHLRKLRVCAQK